MTSLSAASCNSAEKITALCGTDSERRFNCTLDTTDSGLQLKNVAAITPILKQLHSALLAAALISITALNAAKKMG